MRKNLFIGFLIGLLISACSGMSLQGRAPMGNGNSNPSNRRYASNGEQIYFTDTDQNSKQIPYSGGPAFGGMIMSQYLTCAFCHGADAHGGEHVMHMQIMDAPAIDYAALNEMMAEESGTAVKPDGYSLDDFRKAVIEGKHPDGDTLKTDMPRWQMSDQDLLDLFTYLKSLP